MTINEIIILLLGIAISVTLLLIFRRIFFGKKTVIEIYKKVNSRELFESSQKSDDDLNIDSEIGQESQDLVEDNVEYESVFREEENTNLITIHLEAEEHVFNYKELLDYLDKSQTSYKDEGGWLKIFLEDNDHFMFVNGLNPGKFSEEENILSTSIMTIIYSMKPKGNSVNALAEMIKFAERIAKDFSTQILDGDRNALTQQMVEHYSQIAEEFDLNNIS